jgi:uncharacterized protein (TIGR03435 family)
MIGGWRCVGWLGGAAGAVAVAAIAVSVAGLPALAQNAASVEPEKMMAPDAHPAFEVATIKLSDPNDGSDGFHTDGHRIYIENQTMNKLILYAYGVHEKQIVDGPEWFSKERYDIRGVPDIEGVPDWKQQQEMLRKLLAERFGLVFHREKRELAVYAITVAKGGAKLTKSKSDPNGLPDSTGDWQNGQQVMRFTNNGMADFALCMQFFLDRPAVDQTGLPGKYDFVLKWTPDVAKVGDASAAPGIFTAVQEQLGLKLEPVKASADVLVVDKVERPSAN